MLGECHMKVDFKIKFQNEIKCFHFNKKKLRYHLNLIFEEVNLGSEIYFSIS